MEFGKKTTFQESVNIRLSFTAPPLIWHITSSGIGQSQCGPNSDVVLILELYIVLCVYFWSSIKYSYFSGCVISGMGKHSTENVAQWMCTSIFFLCPDAGWLLKSSANRDHWLCHLYQTSVIQDTHTAIFFRVTQTATIALVFPR